MRKSEKVIITCAITGSIHTPTMSPYLPITPDQIAEQAVAAAEAGAAILHLHARDPEDGRPSPDPDLYMQFLPRIKQQTNAVINITTGGAPGFTEDDRLAGPLRASPEMTSLNMGSMNFGMFDAANKYKEWKYPWEKAFLERSRAGAVMNSFAFMERIIRELGLERGAKFEFECYDLGHLYSVAYFADRKLIEPPFLIQGVFGVLGGIGADLENLQLMRQTADRLFGNNYYWSCFGVGRMQMRFATMSSMIGGNIRVGLEDSLYIAKGKLAQTNVEQVRKVRAILDHMEIDVASPDEARAMLGLKGADNVAF